MSRVTQISSCDLTSTSSPGLRFKTSSHTNPFFFFAFNDFALSFAPAALRALNSAYSNVAMKPTLFKCHSAFLSVPKILNTKPRNIGVDADRIQSN